MSVLPVPSFLDDVKEKGLRKAVYEGVDEVVTRVTAGMNIQDIREALRGESPSRRPNPRLTPHADSFLLHIRPSYYNEAVTGIYPTFRLGWLSTYFFFLEVITGLFLMVFYTPSPSVAYDNMLNILGNVPMGQFMRDLHRLGAEAMVLVVVLHMLRTFITGSYKRPRQFTWFTGVVLLLVTLFLSFSGYLLPWDQLAFWAVTIGTSMAEAAPPEVVGTNVNLLLRGAPDIGANGLLRFYLLHVFALPSVLLLFLFVHYYKVIIHGHSLPPQKEQIGEDTAKRVPVKERVYFIPDVLTTELMWTAGVTFIMVLMVTWFYHAPLENHANPQVTPLHTTAPWYFLWLQGMLKIGDKILWGVVIPTLIFGFMFVMPYLDVGRSRRYSHRRVALTLGALTSGLLLMLQFMGTPFYAVDTAADQEVIEHIIPGEKIRPIRVIPYGELETTTTDPIYGNIANPDISGYSIDELDDILPDMAIVLTEGEDNLEALEDTYGVEQPELYHALEELHELLFEEFTVKLPNAKGYIIISDFQEGLKRVQVVLTWDEPELDNPGKVKTDDEGNAILKKSGGDEGEPIRVAAHKYVYIHEESEWHEH